MNDDSLASQFVGYLFLLSLALILVVYYVGLQTDVQTVGAALGNLFNYATGRNQGGTAFLGYPGGTPTSQPATATTTTGATA